MTGDRVGAVAGPSILAPTACRGRQDFGWQLKRSQNGSRWSSQARNLRKSNELVTSFACKRSIHFEEISDYF